MLTVHELSARFTSECFTTIVKHFLKSACEQTHTSHFYNHIKKLIPGTDFKSDIEFSLHLSNIIKLLVDELHICSSDMQSSIETLLGYILMIAGYHLFCDVTSITNRHSALIPDTLSAEQLQTKLKHEAIIQFDRGLNLIPVQSVNNFLPFLQME